MFYIYRNLKGITPFPVPLFGDSLSRAFARGILIIYGSVKSLSPPAAAKYYFERHIIFEISLREISKMMCLSKDNLARSAMKKLFTQPPSKDYSAAEGGILNYQTATIQSGCLQIVFTQKKKPRERDFLFYRQSFEQQNSLVPLR